MLNTTVGKIAEMDFAKLCMQKGLHVSMPIDDCSGYDAIVEKDGKLLKVQIKSTLKESSRRRESTKKVSYKVAVQKGWDGRDSYSEKHFDILAVYLHALDVWYFFRFSDLTGTTIRIYPDAKISKFHHHKENWDILLKNF